MGVSMTRMSLIAGIAGIWLIGCGGGGGDDSAGDDSGDDAGVTDYSDLTCDELVDLYSGTARVVGKSCTTAEDCMVLRRAPTTCGCAPYVTDPCEGIPIARSQFGPTTELVFEEITDEFDARCLDDATVQVCDCAPQDLLCGEDGQCALGTANTCNPPP